MVGGLHLKLVVGPSGALANLGREETLGTFSYFELDFLAFFKRAVALHLDSSVMHENVLASLLLDEAEAFFCVEPFNGTGRHSAIPLVRIAFYEGSDHFLTGAAFPLSRNVAGQNHTKVVLAPESFTFGSAVDLCALWRVLNRPTKGTQAVSETVCLGPVLLGSSLVPLGNQ
jgi:hypothetical protein